MHFISYLLHCSKVTCLTPCQIFCGFFSCARLEAVTDMCRPHLCEHFKHRFCHFLTLRRYVPSLSLVCLAVPHCKRYLTVTFRYEAVVSVKATLVGGHCCSSVVQTFGYFLSHTWRSELLKLPLRFQITH